MPVTERINNVDGSLPKATTDLCVSGNLYCAHDHSDERYPPGTNFCKDRKQEEVKSHHDDSYKTIASLNINTVASTLKRDN